MIVKTYLDVGLFDTALTERDFQATFEGVTVAPDAPLRQKDLATEESAT